MSTWKTLVLTILVATSVRAADQAIERIHEATKVIDEVMATPEKAIPSDLMNKAHCVAIVPGVKKAGFGIGGKYGKGLLSCRGQGGKGWTAPSTVRVEGGSFGLQIGGSSTDYVMLVMNERGKEKLLGSKFTLGGDASVAGGPVGRSALAQTDAQMSAEILSYSRSRGAFAGVSLDGATLRQDADDNKKIYGRDVTPQEILQEKFPVPPSAKELVAALTKYSAAEHN